jgi:hypothetical protein
LNISFDDSHEVVKIVNPSSKPGVVLVLPMTRVKENSVGNWERILQIASSSNLLALFLIDKTPLKGATSYFLNAELPKNTQVHILQRDISEDLYDSLLSIALEGNVWIMQLHDDDSWSGVIELPDNATQNEIFPVDFYISVDSRVQKIDWNDSPPARINFTLIPRKIWTKFAEYASEQGGHLAASTDYTLNLVARLTCEKREDLDFEYIYDSTNWNKRTLKRNQLTRLSKLDGWLHLSGTEVQLLNRSLDALSCLHYFKDLIPDESFNSEIAKLLSGLKLSLTRSTYLHSRRQILLLLVSICRLLRKLLGNKNVIERLEGKLIATTLVIRISRARTPKEIQFEVLEFRKLAKLPKLEKRFEFWIRNLGVDA